MVHRGAQMGNSNYRSVVTASACITSTFIPLARQVILKSHSHEMGKYFLPDGKTLQSYTVFQGVKTWDNNLILFYHWVLAGRQNMFVAKRSMREKWSNLLSDVSPHIDPCGSQRWLSTPCHGHAQLGTTAD